MCSLRQQKSLYFFSKTEKDEGDEGSENELYPKEADGEISRQKLADDLQSLRKTGKAFGVSGITSSQEPGPVLFELGAAARELLVTKRSGIRPVENGLGR